MVVALYVNIDVCAHGEVGLYKARQHFTKFVRIRLAPQMAGVAKAVGLIAVVVTRGKALHTVGNGGIRDSVPVLDGAGAEADVVPRVGLVDTGMVRDGKTQLMRLVFKG